MPPLKDYEKIRTVGKGAFGTAVLYRKLLSDQLVVIKEVNMMELSANERQMALNEVQVLSSLNHPNIIRYMSSFEVEGFLMIEMEYADGGTLAQLINRKQRLSEPQVLTLFQQCVAAIEYMHQNSILHRDLKTANVFLTKNNLIKVGDFGISKIMSTKGQAQTVLGTPYYISPEMCEGKQYNDKSDVWALGCILYEMACLQKTFQGNNLPALVNKIMKGTFEPLPDMYSKDLRELVTDLLQKDPSLRPTATDTHTRINIMLEKVKLKGQHACPILSTNPRSVLYQMMGNGSSFSLNPVPLPPTLKIIQLAVSNTHYVAVASDTTVFTWGEGKRGQLGHPEVKMWMEHPTPVRVLADRSICQVGAGDGFSIFLSESGVLMSCGDGTFGCLGHGDWNGATKPLLIDKLLNEEVKQVECGEHHCVALTNQGELFTWGHGEAGRLGTGRLEDVCSPTRVTTEAKEIKSIHCGPDCTAIITQAGTVYACGANRHNKLGLNNGVLRLFGFRKNTVETIPYLTEVKSLNRWLINSISLAANHSAALTECGRVVTMGRNIEGQTAHNKESPRVMKALEDKIAMVVTCGPTYTVMTSVCNVLYFWGTRYLSPGTGTGGGSTISLLHSQVREEPEQVLALYASPTQVARGESAVVCSVHTLWDTLLILVDTTVPLSQEATGQLEYDTIGPIPPWITSEVVQSEHNWEDNLLPR